MKIRIISGLLGLPISIFILYLGGIYLKITLLLISLIGMMEFYKALSKKNLKIHYIGYIFNIIFYLTLGYSKNNTVMILLFIFIISLFIYLIIFNSKVSISDVLVTFFGFVYVGMLISSVFLVRELSLGVYYVLLMFICSWGCDTFAYFIGVKFGKHKLIPNLSPKKTIEGSIGGIIGSTVITFITFQTIFKFEEIQNSELIYKFVFFGFICSIFSQFGDLSASSIKRYANIKDYGNLIPGHGGVLDRFDSVLFVSGIVYIFAVLWV